MLSGCVSSNFKPYVAPNAINIGMSESEFIKQYGSLGEKMYYSDTDIDSFLWILNTGDETIWLSGNAFWGGTITIRHHMTVINFDDNKVSKVHHSYMDAHDKNIMKADAYKFFYSLGESLETCKSYLSSKDRGRYGYVLMETINSWVYSADVFKLINQYNRRNGNFLSPQGESQCTDVLAYLEKASHEIAQINKQKK